MGNCLGFGASILEFICIIALISDKESRN